MGKPTATEMKMTGVSRSEAASLLKLLRPLDGNRIPMGRGSVSVSSVISALEAIVADAGSLDALIRPLEDEQGAPKIERTGVLRSRDADVAFENVDARLDLAPYLDNADLSAIERQAVDLCFGLTSRVPLLSVEASAIMGVSRQAVEQARDRALRKLRAAMV